jgi:hypothetical protein
LTGTEDVAAFTNAAKPGLRLDPVYTGYDRCERGDVSSSRNAWDMPFSVRNLGAALAISDFLNGMSTKVDYSTGRRGKLRASPRGLGYHLRFLSDPAR